MPENIIINVETDVSKLTPVIDLLVKLGQVSEEDAATFKKLAAASAQVTTETVKTTEAIKAGEAATKQASATKEAALAKEIARLKELQTLSAKAADPISAQKFAAAIKDSEVKIQSLNASLNKTPQPIKAADTAFKSLRTQLLEARNEAVRLAEKFGEFSPQALAAAQSAAKIDDKVKDLNRTLQALNPDQKFGAFVQLGVGISGAFTAAQGAMALFGSESEDVQKALLKVQGALALTQGLQSVLGLKDAFRDLRLVLGLTSVAQAGLATATTAEAAATTAASTATKGFTASLLASPLLPIILLLGTLVGAYLLLTKSKEKNIALTSEEIEELNKQAETLRGLRSEVTKLQLEIDKTKGTKTELEFNLAVNRIEFDDALAKIQADIIAAKHKITEAVNEEIPLPSLSGLTAELGNNLQLAQEVQNKYIKRRVDFFKTLAKDAKFGLTELQEQEKILREKFAKENELSIAQEDAKKEKKEKVKVIDVDKKDFDTAVSLLNQYFREKEIATFASGKTTDEINAEVFQNEVERLREFVKLQEKFFQDSSATRLEIEKKLFIDISKLQDDFEKNLNRLNAERIKNNKAAIDKMADDEKKAADDQAKTILEIIDLSSQVAQSLTNLIATDVLGSKDASIQALEEQKDATLKNFDDELQGLDELNKNRIISDGKYAEQKKILEKQKADAEIAANKKIAEEKRRAFIANRIASLASAAINIAEGITKAIAQTGILSPFVIPALAALGALQIATIFAQPIPKFKKGKLDIMGKPIDSEGGFHAILHPHESVMTAGETKMFMPTLSAIKKGFPAHVLNSFVVEGKGGRVEAYIDERKFGRMQRKTMREQAILNAQANAKYLNKNSIYSPIRGEFID